MTYTLRFLPEIEEDAMSGYLWYEEKAPGLGDDFLRMFYACVSELTRHPRRYRQVSGEFRRCLLRRFPYAIYYRLQDRTIVVYGLFHCARDPQGIHVKLRDRDEPLRQ